jgi:hypothetical protein
MTARVVVVASSAMVVATLQVSAATVSAEDKTLVARLCRNDAICEAAQLKLLASFQSEKDGARSVTVGSIPDNVATAHPAQTKQASQLPVSTKASTATLPTLSNSFPFPEHCLTANQALFIRSDSLDNFNYMDMIPSSPSADGPTGGATSGTPANAVSKGASINYADNRNAATQTAAINARVSYLLIGRTPCSPPPLKDANGNVIKDANGKEFAGDNRQPFIGGFGFAPFISSSGTWNEPFITTATTTKTTPLKSTPGSMTTTSETTGAKTTTITTTSKGTIITTTHKTSTSVLRFGADFQTSLETTQLLGGLLPEQYFYLSPFYETDYRGLAQIDGVDVSWQPVSFPLHLGVAPTQSVFSFMWQFKAEAELTQVNNPGYTEFITGGRHALVGDTIRANVALFPLNSGISFGEWMDNWVAGRLSFIGTQQYYWDAATKQTAPYYSAILQYKFGECKRDSKSTPIGTTCTIQGSSSLSLEYDWGRDKDTYVKTNQILIKLAYSY